MGRVGPSAQRTRPGPRGEPALRAEPAYRPAAFARGLGRSALCSGPPPPRGRRTLRRSGPRRPRGVGDFRAAGRTATPWRFDRSSAVAGAARRPRWGPQAFGLGGGPGLNGRKEAGPPT